ncbi:dol-P-Glc:Glc(2)Man(9)GlcNAc(2)-PP-Dol alpha-1,2-glucosyltransferase [Tripterygium wilfordii]|uniref:dol-P-Glc:Glc(2)Man(9)GlcNAc(2)-PP-Dol alpha-1,2-glucosyltransferase n=1 Tax=Tripterygium wilfordii TaxID=458696 RepID=UPI0018F7F132|nr:dol-P-Glc:Glc(2)Man(9)GlcNAc(2)-PP-Dol alpha-1,2-glucosyltransferase [Tripterygium wilfordii]
MGALAVAAIICLWVIPISIIVNRIVPEPYMDEIFHIPQAQQYCRGNFKSWDPMITTPPGLYCLSIVHVVSLFPGMYFIQAVPSLLELCTSAVLRFTNGVLAVFCGILIYEIVTHLSPSLDKRKATVQAVVLALYPLHWFFTFLYYTDVASLTAVLAMYLACLRKKFHISALLGAVAVVIRQTNVVWVLFVVCTGVIDLGNERNKIKVDGPLLSNRETGHATMTSRITLGSNLKQRKSSGVVEIDNYSTSSQSAFLRTQSSGFLGEIQAIILKSWHIKWELLVSFSPFIIILVSFVAFVHWNGGVVLGAKEAHAVSPHLAQVMYYGLVSALAMAPLHFSLARAADLLCPFRKNKLLSFLQWLAVLTVGLVSVHFFSIAHPYLIADNRHYPFYLWRKVVNAHWLMKYLLVPLYVYSWFSIFNLLGKVRPKIWVLAYFLATAAVLIPAPLIEFRYYTIPFYFLVLHSPAVDSRSWLMMGILYMAVNVFTMMMFLFRPFQWDHEPGVQRFIW